MNPILDGFPEEYEGYLIRTDFRIGMQIAQCLADDDYDDYEKIAISLELLFGKGIPDMDIAAAGLSWFLNAGEERKGSNEEPDNENYFDFEIDSMRIFTAFRSQYGIDLTKENMHWFQFLSMISDLGECAFTKVISYRTMDTSELPANQKKTYDELKRKYSLSAVSYTNEEKERISEFLAELNNVECKSVTE